MSKRATILCLLALGLPGVTVMGIAAVLLADGVALHTDESAWIGSAYYFDLLIRGDLRHPDWRLMPPRESPFVGKFLFGAALSLRGTPVKSIDPLAAWYETWRYMPGGWGEGEARAERQAVADRLSPAARAALRQGRFPPVRPAELVTARLVAVAFGVISAVAVAVVGLKCRGAWTGLLAGMVAAAHKLSAHCFTHALFDIIAVAFSTLAILGLIAVLEETSRLGRSIRLGLVAGFWMALAVGTKMNALIVVLVALELVLILTVRAWHEPSSQSRMPLASLILALVVSLVVFIAINPSLYFDILGGLRDFFAVPARTTRVQAAFLPDFLATPGAKLRTVSVQLCGHPDGLLVLALVFLWPTWQGVRRFSARSVVVLWWWTALIAVTTWAPFAWPRYFVPLVPPAAVLLADVLVGLGAGMWQIAVVRNRRSLTPRPASGSND